MATAKNKIIKQLRKDLRFETVEKVINECGYSVVFFNTDFGDIEIERYDLLEDKNKFKAFTYFETARIVFIDGSLSAEDKLYLALHELGHIVLGHMDSDIFNRNKILMDIDANDFAHKVVYGERKGMLYMNISLFVLSLCFFFGAFFAGNDNEPPQASQTETVEIISQTAAPSGAALEIETEEIKETENVYVTPHGERFHRKDCRYTKNKTLTVLPRTDAALHYSPCTVCNP